MSEELFILCEWTQSVKPWSDVLLFTVCTIEGGFVQILDAGSETRVTHTLPTAAICEFGGENELVCGNLLVARFKGGDLFVRLGQKIAHRYEGQGTYNQ